MAFWGNEMIFDGVSCREYHLSLYDIDGSDSIDSPIAGTVDIIEEQVGNKWKPYFYGTRITKKLEFEIVFGIDEGRMDNGEYLTRNEIDEITSWLIGHNEYKWLEIIQEDMLQVRFKAMITELSLETNGNQPYAFRATVTCDSPYAYEYPIEYPYNVSGELEILFFNPCCLNTYYRPTIVFQRAAGDTFEITNESDGGRTFTLYDIPAAATTVTIHNDSCVIANNADLNLYGGCNFQFLRLVRGENHLIVHGTGRLIIKCEFPRNIGG